MKFLVFIIVQALSRVFVFSPSEMREEFESRYNQGEISASLGNFGKPPYGTSFTGYLFYPINVNERNGCIPLSPAQFSSEIDPEIANTPIFMFDRGECSFVVKVRHAEDIGAKLVIIINNVGTDPNDIIMADNGMGGNLQIPALLISQDDGNIIKKHLKDSSTTSFIALSVSFDMNKLPKKINYSLWTSPTSEASRYFLMSFASIGSDLDKQVAEFTPHFVLSFCQACEKKNYLITDKDCVSGGRYCCIDPDEPVWWTGRDVIYEDIRQLCLFSLTSATNYRKWFNYQSEYYKMCSTNLFSSTCSKDVLKKIGVDVEKIEKCVNDSFEGDDHNVADNKLLRNEVQAWREVNLPYYPSIIINEQVYRGDFEPSAVLGALCAGYSWGSEPTLCKKLHPNSHGNEEHDDTVTTIIISISIIAGILIVIGLLILYRSIVKKDLNRDVKVQVNNAVAKYFQLEEYNQK